MPPAGVAGGYWAWQGVLRPQPVEGAASLRAPGCAADSEVELHQICGADPESLLVVQVKLAEGPPDA